MTNDHQPTAGAAGLREADARARFEKERHAALLSIRKKIGRPLTEDEAWCVEAGRLAGRRDGLMQAYEIANEKACTCTQAALTAARPALLGEGDGE